MHSFAWSMERACLSIVVKSGLRSSTSSVLPVALETILIFSLSGFVWGCVYSGGRIFPGQRLYGPVEHTGTDAAAELPVKRVDGTKKFVHPFSGKGGDVDPRCKGNKLQVTFQR